MRFLKTSLARILRILAILTVRKFEPGVVGVTGSVGKTSTKEMIGVVLKAIRRVRVAPESHNNEFGLPLTVIGEWSERDLELVSKETAPGISKVKKMWFWGKVLVRGVLQLLFLDKARYPELLVLEYGADRPGNLKYLAEIVRPQISVVTAVGEVPVHVEFYESPDAVSREKARLVEMLLTNGFAVLNIDDPFVGSMRERTRAHVLTFGSSPAAEMRFTNFEHRAEEGKPMGVSFKLEYGGSFVPVRIDGAFGRAVAYAAAASACIGIIFGMHLVRIAEALSYYEAPRHRMKLIHGIRNSWIIDDSYNASPLSMTSAIDTVRHLPGVRKIAVLGDMLELGVYSIEAHENLGKEAAKVFDVLVTVGPRAKFIAEAARERGMARRNLFFFDSVEEASGEVQGLIRKGDLVLLKASRAVGLDRMIPEIQQPS